MAAVALTVIGAVLVGVLATHPPFQIGAIALLLVSTIVLELRGGVWLRAGRAKIRFNTVSFVAIGSCYVLGPVAGVVAGVASLVTGLARRRPILKTVFNSAMRVLSYAAAVAVFDLLKANNGGSVELLIVDAAIGGATTWVVNQVLLAGVLALEGGLVGSSVRKFLAEPIRLLPDYLAYGLTALGVLAASKHLGVPWALLTLAGPVGVGQASTIRWLREQDARIEQARSGFNATLISLSKAIDLRDSDTEGHCRRVVEYSMLMGRELDFKPDQLTKLCHGALLHDIGKIGVPDAILHKPGPLTEEEWAVMKTHPSLGAMMIADVEQLNQAREVVLSHHERFDGKGYPRGIKADEIPMEARVFSIADAFDAMMSDRPYRPAMSLEHARDEVTRCSGTQFDPKSVAAFNKIPDGRLLEISKRTDQPTEDLLASLPV